MVFRLVHADLPLASPLKAVAEMVAARVDGKRNDIDRETGIAQHKVTVGVFEQSTLWPMLDGQEFMHGEMVAVRRAQVGHRAAAIEGPVVPTKIFGQGKPQFTLQAIQILVMNRGLCVHYLHVWRRWLHSHTA